MKHVLYVTKDLTRRKFESSLAPNSKQNRGPDRKGGGHHNLECSFNTLNISAGFPSDAYGTRIILLQPQQCTARSSALSISSGCSCLNNCNRRGLRYRWCGLEVCRLTGRLMSERAAAFDRWCMGNESRRGLDGYKRPNSYTLGTTTSEKYVGDIKAQTLPIQAYTVN